MRKFITQISLGDFLKLYPEVLQDDKYKDYLTEEGKSSFPLAIAIHNEYPNSGYVGKYIGYFAPVFLADEVIHIYSTRDYWEVVRAGEELFRYKLPKDETKSIYLVIAEDE